MKTNLAIVDNGAPTVTAEQVALIKTTVAKDATDTELQLFLYDCPRQGVHPLDKLIHFTKRLASTRRSRRIDFMRQRAAQTGEYARHRRCGICRRTENAGVRGNGHGLRFVQGQRYAFAATARWTEYKPDRTISCGKKCRCHAREMRGSVGVPEGIPAATRRGCTRKRKWTRRTRSRRRRRRQTTRP